MRFRSRLAVSVIAVVILAALMPAADPPPLLKAVTPAGGALRVRAPVTPGFPNPMTFTTAQVPNGKAKSKMADAKVAWEVLPGQSYVTLKKLESWGYEPGKSKEFILPELHLSVTQIAPKPTKGSDVVLKIPNLKLVVIDNPASKDDTVHMADISLNVTTLFGNAERTFEPRISFADKFLEMTAPAAWAAKKPGTDAVMAPEVSATANDKLLASVAPTMNRVIPSDNPAMAGRGMPVFTYAAVDGQDFYKTPDGKTLPVSVAVSSISNMPSGVMVTLGLARGCKIEFDAAAAGEAALGVDAKSAFVPGKLKELRIGMTVDVGKGKKEQRDIVVKDIEVKVDKNISEGYVLIGQKFMDAYFADAVYSHAGDGWKLHGRTNPDLHADIKTRPKKP